MDIEKMYDKIALIDSNNHLKAGLYFYIIQLKKNDSSLNDVVNSIYLDAKHFISIYINSVEERDLGYDIIDTKKIIKCINYIENSHEQYLLAQNTYRLLKSKGFEDESNKLKYIVNTKKYILLKNKPNCLGKYIRLLLHLSTYNLFSIILTISFLFLISFIVLLPAPYESWHMFNVTYVNFSNVFLINHFINILSNIFNISDTFKIETTTVYGILSIILIKLFYIIFIVNYLFKKVIDILNKN